MADKNPKPVDGVTVDPATGVQSVSWDGVVPDSDQDYGPGEDGSHIGFPVSN